MRKFFILAAAVFLIGSIGCKKNKNNKSTDQLVKDTALSYARDIYIWYNQIPSSLNAQNYTDPAGIMQAIRPYSIEPGFTNPVDRFSFGILQSEWN